MIYPIGIQNFESLINDGYVYVDKTALVYQMATTGRYYFLSRPRRFGKSLLLSTLEAYLSGKKELFRGLAIEKLEHKWEEHPILHLDLNTAKYDAMDSLNHVLDDSLKKWEEISRSYRVYIKLEKRLSENTVESYMRDLRQFAHFILRFYDVPPRKVEAPMIERYLALLYDQGREKTSQARALSGIRSFYNYLMLTDVIDSTPTQFIDTPKFGRHLPDILTVEEIDRIVAAVDTSTVKGRRDSAMLEVLYSCGLRVSELTSLRLGDLFFGEGYIRVTGKGDKQRLVPVSGAAREKIQRYLDDRATKTSASDVVFLNNRGTQLTRVMVFTILREAVHRAGIDKHISPHTFRHSFATHLLEGGASIRQVQEMLGHESILTTEIYTHLEGDHLRDTVEKYLPL